jgi:hypothetical protein
VFWIILILSIYHFIRDVLQTFGADNFLTNILHRPHAWCNNYCDYVTYPLDLLGIVGSSIILKRSRLGKLGTIVLISLPMWLLALLLP